MQFARETTRNTLFVLFAVMACSATFADDHWRQFRGADGQGHSADSDVPIRFSLTENLRWRTEIDGKGWSSPVVADGQIWLTTALTSPATEEETSKKLAKDPLADIKEVAGTLKLFAVCIDFASGEIRHHIGLAEIADPEPINPLNTYASPTPVLDDGKVFCHFGNYGTWCLDAKSGTILWHEQIVVDYGVGPGSSPIIFDDLLILACDGCDQQFVVALDKRTGKQVWKTARPPQRPKDGEMRKSFCTPIVIDVDGKKQIVVPAAQWIAAYEPRDGKEIWRIDHGDGFSLGVTPLFSHGLIIFSTGYGRPDLVAVRPDGHGDVTATHIVWRVSRGAPNKPSPVIVGDAIYMIADNGVLTQLNLDTGREVWRKRIGSEYSASPVAIGDKIYFPSHDGVVTVVQAGHKFEFVAENKLEARLMASPAVVDGALLIRSEQALMRIGQ